MPTSKGGKINCFGMISRNNNFVWNTTTHSINSNFMLEQLDRFSLTLTKPTVVVLDNAQAHKSTTVRERLDIWQSRGLYLFYLPTYSPQLNIAETVWQKLKYEWLQPEDYQTKDKLFYAVNRAFAAIGSSLYINFLPFTHTLN